MFKIYEQYQQHLNQNNIGTEVINLSKLSWLEVFKKENFEDIID